MKKRWLIVIALVLLARAAWAQGCAVCTKTAAGLGANQARGLNGGILYLAAVPLAIMGSLGFVWWKYNRNVR